MFEFKVPSTLLDTLRSTDYSTLHSAHTVCVHTLYLNLETLDSAYSASPHWTHSLFSLVQATATHTKIYKHGSPRRIRQHGISDLLLYEDVVSDLVVRRGRGELHVACYQIWMNPLNVTLNLIRCSLRRRVQRRLHERAATPDFTDPIHSRLQPLARTNRPARARIHTGISGATGDEREA